ncbi:hypothetical protein [Chitinimonas sp.]|uniref:hypothetical protein n=1 Tax=Chitinimonas sp. TaxID=1934313 RepID=UPI0035B1CF10
MIGLDPKVAAQLRRQAEQLAQSRGINLLEARAIIWAAYQRDLQSARDPPPAAPTAPAPPVNPIPGVRNSRWNDTGNPPRPRKRALTEQEKQQGKQSIQTILGVIAERKKPNGPKTY